MSSAPVDAPEHCPGTESEDAGKANACAGCPNQTICSSGAINLPDPDADAISEKLSSIKQKVLILSGKGGVGKSTVTSMLARAVALDENKEVGVLDIDICGPSQPRVLGVLSETVHASGSGWSPVFVSDNLSMMSIGFLLGSPQDAVIWRGPKKNGLIKQFLKDVDWGSLDTLFVDTPPGTSDEHLTAVKYMATSPNTAAIIVTTPQEVALLDVRKEITFCNRVNIPIIGIVENMTYFTCPKCKVDTNLFPPSSGGADALAAEFNLPVLGKLPIDPPLAKACDEGVSIDEKSPTYSVYLEIVQKMNDYFSTQQMDSS